MSRRDKIEQVASEHINENVQAVAALYEQDEKALGRHQRGVEGVVRFLGRPRFLYGILGFVSAWILLNLGLRAWGGFALDPPPFPVLQGVVGFSALVMATVILISQNRQERTADHRAHIDLQVNLLAEKKIAKLISLVEELRRDIPIVRDRYDPEAAAMERPADPQVVAKAIEKKPLRQS